MTDRSFSEFRDIPIEEWKDVPGWEGAYQVSCLGRVKSLARTCATKGGAQRRVPELIMNAKLDKDGYPRITLTRDGIGKTKAVHTLVCEAFIGPRPDKMQTRHLNGDPADNRIENLVYGTQEENCADKILHGTDSRGERQGAAKLTDDDIFEIRRLLEADITGLKIAEMFGVSSGHISRIKLGKKWQHLQ